MDSRSISDLDSEQLLKLVRDRQLEEADLLKVLRSPFCTAQIAESIATERRNLDGHAVRELLAGFPGFTFGRAMDLMATLPWTSLLSLSQSPRTPPVVRRQAERKLLSLVSSMSLGERIALARRAHREIFRVLVGAGDEQVLCALLDNPRLVENDILVILNTREPSLGFFPELARHHKWGSYLRVRRALLVCSHTPLPIALSILVQMPRVELRRILEHPNLPEEVREAAESLIEREALGQRRVIDFSGDDSNGGGAQSSEGLW
ncbi:MAG: hypothetical protein LJE93_13765 [Acidobacteria bacterium]|nr:hypothetical protein [Acidobacteriota bacterium]